MKTRGLLSMALAVALAVGVAGCSHNSKHGRNKNGTDNASTSGVGDRNALSAEEQRNLMAQRKIYFDYDRAEIHDQDLNVIAAHSDYLKQNPGKRVRIEGHTDELGSREYNVALGEKRSNTIANAMMANGVSKNQLATVSYGKEKPDDNGHSEESHSLNRRGVFVYEES